MVSASFIPLGTLLVMGFLGASVFVAVNTSLAVATVLLVGAGWTASRASGLRGWRLVTSTALSGAFGVRWCPAGGLSGVQEGQPAVAVKLEQVVDGALEAPLRTRGLLATQ